jgi:hypothetical protein
MECMLVAGVLLFWNALQIEKEKDLQGALYLY